MDINYLAIVVGALSNMLIGAFWYSPAGFGKQWMAMMGFSMKDMEAMKKKAGQSYALMAIGALVMAYVLAHFIGAYGAADAWGGAQVAFWAWLGFVAVLSMGSVLWEGKPWKLFVLNSGYWLVSLLVMGAILGGWR